MPYGILSSVSACGCSASKRESVGNDPIDQSEIQAAPSILRVHCKQRFLFSSPWLFFFFLFFPLSLSLSPPRLYKKHIWLNLAGPILG